MTIEVIFSSGRQQHKYAVRWRVSKPITAQPWITTDSYRWWNWIQRSKHRVVWAV